MHYGRKSINRRWNRRNSVCCNGTTRQRQRAVIETGRKNESGEKTRFEPVGDRRAAGRGHTTAVLWGPVVGGLNGLSFRAGSVAERDRTVGVGLVRGKT